MSTSSRRTFISTSAMLGVGAVLATPVISSILSSCATSSRIGVNKFNTGFDQLPLPYNYNAIEPWIDAETMDIHYNKHAAAYSKNVKEAAKEEGVDMGRPLEEVLGSITKFSAKMRNNAGGHYNHEMFWKLLKANSGSKPQGAFLSTIERDFSTLDNFKEKFSAAAKSKFGSGWAWLVYTKNKQLVITSTSNQDNPLMNIKGTSTEPFVNGFPVICLDVWEHAYYLKYRNKRAEYVENFWKILNWDYAQERFNAIR